jgi:hypothetical protein
MAAAQAQTDQLPELPGLQIPVVAAVAAVIHQTVRVELEAAALLLLEQKLIRQQDNQWQIYKI